MSRYRLRSKQIRPVVRRRSTLGSMRQIYKVVDMLLKNRRAQSTSRWMDSCQNTLEVSSSGISTWPRLAISSTLEIWWAPETQNETLKNNL